MKFYFLIVIFCIALTTSIQAQNHKYDLWKKPSFFRGFNLLPIATHTIEDYRDLKATGANLAQLGIDGFDSVDTPYEVNAGAIDATDRMVRFCDSAGLYYTITVRSGPGRRDVYWESEGGAPKSTIWKNKQEQNKYAQMLREIVSRYKDDTLFVGIGTMVEPNPLFDQLNINAQMLRTALEKEAIDFKAINQLFIDEVRKADAFIPIIVQNYQFSCPEFFSITDTYTDEYLVYEFHSYRPWNYANNKTPNTVIYPGEFISFNDLTNIYFDKSVLKKNVFKYVDSVQKATGKPFFLGEFGILFEQGGGPLYLKDMNEICIEEGWHFALWLFRGGGGEGGWDYELKSPEYWQTVLNMFKYSDVDDPRDDGGEDVILYPNPANDFIYLKLNDNFRCDKIEIYSISGEKIKTINSEIREMQNIYVGDLMSGIYFVRYCTNNKLFSITR
ncbi:MAG: T9SS type A sorting domain-containing protein [Bacteroidetes bacterium]|nr:MAG: T9SS type A sorting domain-containing protein [Bacteroidota bacterium]